jgi:peroxiredoxin
MDLHGRAWLVTLTLATSLLLGCAHRDHIKAGRAHAVDFAMDVEVGDPYVDFMITTADGDEVQFNALRGRVTVLLLPDPDVVITCEQLMQWAKLVEAFSSHTLRAVVVPVVRSDECDRILAASAECELPWDQVVVVCDPHGDIENLYGPHGRGQYFVLDNYLKIAGTGPMEARAELRATLNNVVEEIREYDRRTNANRWN